MCSGYKKNKRNCFSITLNRVAHTDIKSWVSANLVLGSGQEFIFITVCVCTKSVNAASKKIVNVVMQK
jgi:hypothetical protein